MNLTSQIKSLRREFEKEFVYFYKIDGVFQDDWKGEPPRPSTIQSFLSHALLKVIEEIEGEVGKMSIYIKHTGVAVELINKESVLSLLKESKEGIEKL